MIMHCHLCVRIRFSNKTRAISFAWFVDSIHYRELCFHADTPYYVQSVSVSHLEVCALALNSNYFNVFFCIIEKLDRCPICRAPITAFFRIRSEDYVTASSTVLDQEPKQKTSVNWIDALNDRLTDFLGFR